jgi:hypothetical protein
VLTFVKNIKGLYYLTLKQNLLKSIDKQKNSVLVLLLHPPGFTIAQDSLPAHNDNYTGIKLALMQAEIKLKLQFIFKN